MCSAPPSPGVEIKFPRQLYVQIDQIISVEPTGSRAVTGGADGGGLRRLAGLAVGIEDRLMMAGGLPDEGAQSPTVRRVENGLVQLALVIGVFRGDQAVPGVARSEPRQSE